MQTVERTHVKMLTQEVAEQLATYHRCCCFRDYQCLLRESDHGPGSKATTIIPYVPFARTRIFIGIPSERLLAYAKALDAELDGLLAGRDVQLVFPSGRVERGAFGRPLAYVNVDGQDFGLDLIESGHALARSATHPKLREHQVNERVARRLKRGVFAER